MIDRMKEHGLKPPQFELDYDVLKVTLRGPGENFMELTEEVIPEDKLKELNERQREALKHALNEGFITNKIYRETNKISDEMARRELREITEKNLLRIAGKGRATRYIPVGD
jgi:predicted HTH transcriptional regulator